MGGDLDVRAVENLPKVWDTFVRNHLEATVFHTREWLEAVEATFGYEPRHRLLHDATGEVVGVLPGFVVPDPPAYSVLNPFCEYGFPLLADRVDGAAVLSTVADGVGRLGALVIKDVDWSGVRGYSTAGYGGTSTGTVHRLDADRPFEEVRESAFAKQARQRTRAAEDHGVDVVEGDVETFYPLYVDTMERLGSPQFPSTFFEALDARLGEALTVLVAEAEGRPIGAMFLLKWGDVSMIWGNGSKASSWELRPNHLLYTRAIERACRDDSSVVDFGRSRQDSGVHEFKSQFGGTTRSLTSFVTPPHRSTRASLEGYERLAPVTSRLAPLITHPSVGPALKRLIHE
ncbi:exosortase [Halobacteriales archaeon QH_8_64_26]|nr:MAG: exosortase [Halobacteriales archaeon QH_8_64_26]